LVTTFVFSAAGDLLETRGAEAMSPGNRLRGFLRFLHTGEVYGIPGQTVAGLASVAATVLVYTGLSLAIRRMARSLGRRSPSTARHQTPSR
jgi:uncharacterized iron-regulated membrane protein